MAREAVNDLARRGLNKMTGLSVAFVTILLASLRPAAGARLLYASQLEQDSPESECQQHKEDGPTIPWGSAAAMISNSSSSVHAFLSLIAAIPKLQSFHSLRNMAATPMSGYSCMHVLENLGSSVLEPWATCRNMSTAARGRDNISQRNCKGEYRDIQDVEPWGGKSSTAQNSLQIIQQIRMMRA